MNNVCVEHDWSWYENDDYGCPVCYGIRLGEERIIALLEAKDEWNYEFSDISDVIALIKGEN